MPARIDWSKRAEYIRARHGVEPAWADEVVGDAHAVWLRPDPASHSGHSVRVIGYSVAAQAVLTVVLVDPDLEPSEGPEGDCWGSNPWVASPRDRQLYGREDE